MVDPTLFHRLYLLDALRGIAALCVVFWHWQHFFYVGDTLVGFDPTQQPFYKYAGVFYRHGGLAVQLFFSISGFVFFWLYAARVAKRDYSVRHFILDRFSRLHPLHVLTFLMVAALQALYMQTHDQPFVYPYNDGYHALLNLALAPAWGAERGWSFNAPVWSVSIEVLMYASFFLITLTGRWRWLLAAAACCVGYWLYPVNYKIGSGLLCFFAGGIAYGLLCLLRQRLGSLTAVVVCTVAAAVAWGLQGIDTINVYLLMGACFPLSIMALAAVGWHWPQALEKSGWMGDISYASYLLHFPLQLMCVIAMDRWFDTRDVFLQPWVMVLFFALLIMISLASHRFFERPVQRYLRHRG